LLCQCAIGIGTLSSPLLLQKKFNGHHLLEVQDWVDSITQFTV
jgi:hypothetical protein